MDDLVALIAAWRAGQQVIPAFSDTTLIDQALFSLSQQDGGSARVNLQRALSITAEPGAEVMRNVLAQLESGDLAGAQVALQALKEQWPLGDPSAGAITFSANCAVCHGPQGAGGIGPALVDNAFIQSKTNAELVAFVLQGRTGTAMAGFKGRLSETEIANVVAFLRLWQK